MKRIMGLCIAVQFAIVTSFAQKPAVLLDNEPGWTKIGETVANFNKEDESILVFGEDQFESIKLKVMDAPLTIDRLQVFYESGEKKGFDVKNKISNGNETREFDLNPDKEVSKVAFTYRTVANDAGKKANVVLYGLVVEDKNDENTSYKKNDDIRDDVSETASKGIATLKDQRHETKVGPNGQTIYIEEASPKYYYVDRQGQQVYVSESQLKDKDDY